MINEADRQYIGLAWKTGGRSRSGTDCVGLAWMWLNEQGGLSFPAPESSGGKRCSEVLQQHCKPGEWERGDLVFFAKRGEVEHVAVHLGGGRLLHIVSGYDSRVDNGPRLLERVGFKVAGVIDRQNVAGILAALADKSLGASVAVPLAIGLFLSALSALIMPSLSGFKSKNGRYGQNALLTQSNPEIPLPDLLGQVVIAGNAVYQQLPDRVDATGNPQKWNQVIVLASGPVYEFDSNTGLRIKGVDFTNGYFNDGTADGIALNPAQTKAEAVTGAIGSDTNVPSMTLYTGAHGISVPVDIRAQYDRGFPIYGFSGTAYMVLRAMDSNKFANLNFTVRSKGRKLRTFDEDGLIVNSVVSENVGTGDGNTVRFKLAFEDIMAVSAVSVDGDPFTEISASNQSGDIFHVNKTKGYIEFITAPASGTITVSYTYYEREFSQNPAMQMVYLLTERTRGRGFDQSRLDWESFVAARDYFDETVSWTNGNGTTSAARYTSNYAIDDRKPIIDHLRAILDACNSALFLSNGRFVLRPRTAESSVFSFDPSNILVTEQGESSLEVTFEDRADKPNRVRVFYHADENLNAESDTPADDEDNQRARAERLGNGGVVDEDLKLPAVTSLSQAERLGEMFVREQTGGARLLKWTANIKSLALQPMDVVDVTHPVFEGTMNVRIEKLEHDENDRMVIIAREYVESAVDL